MKPTLALKRGIRRVQQLCRKSDFSAALTEVEKLQVNWPDNSHLLVLWADLAQLQEKTNEKYDLNDIQNAYRRAIELNGQSAEPLISLGQFLSAVEDDPKGANDCYAKAADLCRTQLRDALLAQASALAELGRRQEAFNCLAEASWLQRRNGRNGDGNGEDDLLERLVEMRKAN